MKDNKPKCWWHPDREARWIVNFGSEFDEDTPCCENCKWAIEKNAELKRCFSKLAIKLIK